MSDSDPRAKDSGGLDADAVREEAERLVATGLAAVSMAADRIGRQPARERGGPAAAGYEALGDMLFGPATDRRHNVANESPECCRCPVCRVIAAARNPDPAVAERLATGVGTLAGGVARLLRTFAGAASAEPASERSGPPDGSPAASARPDRDLDPWAAAVAAPPPPAPEPTRPAAPPKAVAKKAVAKKAVAKKAVAKNTTTRKAAARRPGDVGPAAGGAAQ